MAIVFAILIFSFLIFIHELGHFLAAKASGVQVNEFAMFMGPAIVKWQRGETLYAIRCIPVGGYCAMEGENDQTDNPRAFYRAKWWKRMLILVAGAAMNFVIGILLLVIVLLPAARFATTDVVAVEPGSSLAEGNAVMVGDRLLEMDGEPIYVQSDISLIMMAKGGKTHDLVVLRDGQKVVLEDVLFEAREFVEEDGSTSVRYGYSCGVEEATLGQKLKNAWFYGLDYARSVRLTLEMMIRGDAGLNDVTGAVGIVKMMSDTAENSESAFEATMRILDFGAMISINLAVMNMLPLPALDGGRVACLLITTAVEAVTKKKLDPKYEGYLHAAGLVLLLILSAVIAFKDIIGLFK